jgi:hypothetical protein
MTPPQVLAAAFRSAGGIMIQCGAGTVGVIVTGMFFTVRDPGEP